MMQRSFQGVLATMLLVGSIAAQDPATESQQTQGSLRQRAAKAEVERDYAEAGRLYTELSEQEPRRPEWVLRAAENLGRAQSFNDALTLIEAAIPRFPDVLDLRVKLAKVLHLKADTLRERGSAAGSITFYYQDAEQAAQAVLEVDPSHVEARLLVASAKLHQGALDEAQAIAEKLIEDDASNYGAQAMLAQILYPRFTAARQGNRREAEELGARLITTLTAAIEADPTRAFPHLRLGDVHAWNTNLALALPEYRQAMTLDPDAGVNHVWLKSQLEPEARRAFYLSVRDSVREQPEDSPLRKKGLAVALWYAAEAAFDQQDWSTAAEEFEATFEGLPDFVDTHCYAMQAWFWAEKPQKAARTAVAFAQKNPGRFADMVRENPTALAALNAIAAKAFEIDDVESSRDLNLVVAYARSNAAAWNNYAFLCRETELFEESLSAYRRALSIEPNSPQLLNDCAVILQYHLDSKENLAEARQMYQQAIEQADAVLADAGASTDEKDRAKVARRDARENLREMRR
ncbi:MAG: tetratricopeptide repeat protein [Planctomycetota bacterium]